MLLCLNGYEDCPKLFSAVAKERGVLPKKKPSAKAREEEGKRRPPTQIPSIQLSSRFILVIFALSGFAALTYEVIWTRLLSLVFGSTVYAVSTMLTAFMAGLALGGYLGGLWSDRTKNVLFVLGLVECFIGLFGIWTLVGFELVSPIYFYLYKTFQASFIIYSVALFILSLAIMVPPTTLMGVTFPLVSKFYARDGDQLGTSIGEVYAFNNVGAILGSFSAGFIMVSLVGVTKTLVVAASVNLAIGLFLIFLGRRRSLKMIAPLFLLVASTVYGVHNYSNRVPFYPSFFTTGRFPNYAAYFKLRQSLKVLFHRENAEGTVCVLDLPNSQARFLSHSGRLEGSTTLSDLEHQILSGILPLAARPQAKKILVIGLGTGMTLDVVFSESRQDSQIDFVEINPAIVEAAKGYFFDRPHRSKRVRGNINDARNFINVTEQKYDLITSQPSYPVESSVTNLFVDEFFASVRSRLTKNGVFAQWLPYYWLPDEDVKMLVKTIARWFPYSQVYVHKGDIFVLGAMKPLPVSSDVKKWIDAKAKNLKVALLMDEKAVRKVVNDPNIPLNTDDRPWLELRAPPHVLLGPTEIARRRKPL